MKYLLAFLLSSLSLTKSQEMNARISKINRNKVCRSIIMNNLGEDGGDVEKIQYRVSLSKNVLSCSVKWKKD